MCIRDRIIIVEQHNDLVARPGIAAAAQVEGEGQVKGHHVYGAGCGDNVSRVAADGDLQVGALAELSLIHI